MWNRSRQNSSETFTFSSGTTLCGSHSSYGPKMFQFGPRRNVPRKTSSTQRMMNPKRKTEIAKGLSFSV